LRQTGYRPAIAASYLKVRECGKRKFRRYEKEKATDEGRKLNGVGLSKAWRCKHTVLKALVLRRFAEGFFMPQKREPPCSPG
jgi:hypothetical protein